MVNTNRGRNMIIKKYKPNSVKELYEVIEQQRKRQRQREKRTERDRQI